MWIICDVYEPSTIKQGDVNFTKSNAELINFDTVYRAGELKRDDVIKGSVLVTGVGPIPVRQTMGELAAALRKGSGHVPEAGPQSAEAKPDFSRYSR